MELVGGDAIAREVGFAVGTAHKPAFPGVVDAACEEGEAIVPPGVSGMPLGFVAEVVFGFGGADEGVGEAALPCEEQGDDVADGEDDRGFGL